MSSNKVEDNSSLDVVPPSKPQASRGPVGRGALGQEGYRSYPDREQAGVSFLLNFPFLNSFGHISLCIQAFVPSRTSSAPPEEHIHHGNALFMPTKTKSSLGVPPHYVSFYPCMA